MGLTTYDAQVSFLKPLIRLGVIAEGGSWHGPGTAWGKLWSGCAFGYIVTFHTIGNGPYMRPGTFQVRAAANPPHDPHTPTMQKQE